MAARAKRAEHAPPGAAWQPRIPAVVAPLLVVAGAVCGGPAAALAAHFPADSVVRAILVERVEAGRAVGIVVGLLEEGRTRVLAAGTAGGPGARPLDGRTVFEIGSVTKVFTAALLAEMAGRGEVRLDEPVASLLPPGTRVPAQQGRDITLLDLATHRSALPRLPANLVAKDPANPYAAYSTGALYEFLAGYRPTRAIGSLYEYSNLGVGLLAHALEHRAGKGYEQLLIERVLDPLGLADTRVTLSPGQRARFAAGHDEGGAAVPPWDFPALGGAGALRSTADDLLRFLAAHLDSSGSDLSAALRETRRRRNMAGGTTVDIGLTWHIIQRPAGPMVVHNGGTGGFRSWIGFDPARRAGVVVLVNSAVDADDIGRHLLDPAMPRTPIVRHVEAPIDPRRLDDYPGTYALSPVFAIDVLREGDRLFVQATGQPRFPVYPEAVDRFFLRATEAQLSFERDSTGRVERLVLHQNGRSTPGRRLR